MLRELADKLDAEDDPELARLRHDLDKNEKVVADLLTELIARDAKGARNAEIL